MIADQRVTDANVSLQPGAIVRGRVLDKEGRPITGANLRTEFDQPRERPAAESDADGRFEITSISPGKMLIRVDPAGRAVWHRTMYYPGVHERDDALHVTAEVGKTAEIEIRLRDVRSPRFAPPCLDPTASA